MGMGVILSKGGNPFKGDVPIFHQFDPLIYETNPLWHNNMEWGEESSSVRRREDNTIGDPSQVLMNGIYCLLSFTGERYAGGYAISSSEHAS